MEDLLKALNGDEADEVHVLDVRRNDERSGGGIAGSQHIPIHELPRRVEEVPTDKQVWVHCASGYRAAVASSILARAGRTPVLIDDFSHRIEELDFELEAPAA
jgi:hydroxyacylglutathione hydrolase